MFHNVILINSRTHFSSTNPFHLKKVKFSLWPGESEIITSPTGTAGITSFSNQARVTISCPEKGEVNGKLILLPKSLEELLDIGAKKFGIIPTRILTKEGAEIEELELIRDGDHLVLVSNADTRT